ncbi:LysR family transcriptional regulator [Sphingomonas edaphi]|uniref:LysR family transcriptional regulator n=1 Tax=Sphingomonas edaphi TaxID=2315689 RepID=A0A418PYG8_9SPHN|nr:LysR family transcriptional regulator [Sphingomonas edaphi]RIX27097.1 LysR family transcriptional regulator [Sphingomonas edaphi]
MFRPDLNLLETLDVLLDEGNVTRAAKRLALSPSAMSRALARLRNVTGDQILVRAGRGLVPTPRAEEMRAKVRELVEEAQVLLRPSDGLELATLHRTFTIRASDGFAETFGPRLIQKVSEEAPSVQLRFVRKLDKSSQGLRDGTVDLETGVVAASIGPEVRAQALFSDRYVAVTRAGHALVRQGLTIEGYAEARHVIAWREGIDLGGVDDRLAEAGYARDVAVTVDGFSAALALARGSDLIATVPERHTEQMRADMQTFALPVLAPEFTISLLWHPRLEGDPAHRWLRNSVREICQVG